MYRWLLALCLVATPAYPDASLWGHFASKHWNGKEYNEINPGLGIVLPIQGKWSLELGMYENSFSLPTKYVWGGYSMTRGPLRIRALAGLADRYSDRKFEEGQAVPVVGLSFEYKRARATLLPGAIGFSWKLMEWE